MGCCPVELSTEKSWLSWEQPWVQHTTFWCASLLRAFPVLPGSVSGHFVSPSMWGPLCHGGTAWGCALADVCGAPGQQTGTWQQPQVAPPNTAWTFPLRGLSGVSRESLGNPNSFIGLCLTHWLMKARADWPPPWLVLQYLGARPPLWQGKGLRH